MVLQTLGICVKLGSIYKLNPSVYKREQTFPEARVDQRVRPVSTGSAAGTEGKSLIIWETAHSWELTALWRVTQMPIIPSLWWSPRGDTGLVMGPVRPCKALWLIQDRWTGALTSGCGLLPADPDNPSPLTSQGFSSPCLEWTCAQIIFKCQYYLAHWNSNFINITNLIKHVFM